MPLSALPNLSAKDRQAERPAAAGLPGIASQAEALATEDLMARVQQDDMEAYRELIRRYQNKVFRVISGYHRDREDAMEVLQDTFLKVYIARQTWERKSSFSGWLYRIAINTSIDRHRREERRKTASLEEMVESQDQSSATFSHERTPLDQLRDGERRRFLEAAVRRLPERQRNVVSLRYFAELQLEEIAHVLGCPLGTVKSNLHKAVLSLKGILLEHKEALA